MPELGQPIVVIGAGASGLLSARALLRSGHRAVVLVERNRSWGAGPAYSTPDPLHLLNVPAAKLSVDTDLPADFVDWASAQIGRVEGSSFLPRSLYGEYLQDSLAVAARSAGHSSLKRVLAEATALHLERGHHGDPTRVRVDFADGTSVVAAHVVLALGNPPPRPLPAGTESVVDDPWSALLTARVKPDDSVLLVGSGLTAVDLALSFAARGHRGPIRMVSRHGLLPRPHGERPAAPMQDLDPFFVPTARSAVAWVRAAIVEAGGDWRAVFDAIRNDTNSVWNRLPEPERARLLRHAARYWEVHRHRMAPEVATRINDLLSTGRSALHAGTVERIENGPGRTSRVIVRDARPGRSTLAANWVVNCTGPNFDLRCWGVPLTRSLLDHGHARRGPLGLGFDVTADGSLVDSSGRASSTISVVGPLRRGAEWETTAIPDIRRQAEALASRLGHSRRGRTHGAVPAPAATRHADRRGLDRRPAAPMTAEVD